MFDLLISLDQVVPETKGRLKKSSGLSLYLQFGLTEFVCDNAGECAPLAFLNTRSVTKSTVHSVNEFYFNGTCNSKPTSVSQNQQA